MNTTQGGSFEEGFSQMDAKDLFFMGDGEEGGGNDPLLSRYDENGNEIDGDGEGEAGSGNNPDGSGNGGVTGGNDGGEDSDPDGSGDGSDDNGDIHGVSGINAKSIIEKLSGKGLIGNINDIELMVDDKPIDLSEIKNEDDLVDILEGLIKTRDEDMMKDKVDTSGMSDLMKRLMEVDRAGGNTSMLIETYQKLQAPVDGVDLDTKQGQLSVIYHYYKMKGLSDEDIKDNIEMMEAKGDDFIEAKANKFNSVIKEEMDKRIEEEKENAEKRKAEMVEQMKSYKKNIKESIKKSYQVKDGIVAKAVDFVTKPVNKRGNTAIDMAYMEAIKNPEKAADLIMFLMNKEEFLKQKTNKVGMETKKSVINVLRQNKRDNKADTGGQGGGAGDQAILDVGLAEDI